jgi:hypothetical protein
MYERIEARWRRSKYYRLAQECITEGRDWRGDFERRGWQL